MFEHTHQHGSNNDAEVLDFDLIDVIDAENTDAVRALVFDLPARPGTKR